jgi:hypothetical protein
MEFGIDVDDLRKQADALLQEDGISKDYVHFNEEVVDARNKISYYCCSLED